MFEDEVAEFIEGDFVEWLLDKLKFIQSTKFPTFSFEFQKISERFLTLTPEQKRQYFINVDE